MPKHFREGAMIQQPDLKAKTDAELLQIWRNQVDYRDDVVAWAKDEIDHRRLETANVQVETIEDRIVVDKNRTAFNAVKFAAVIHCLFGLGAVISGFFVFSVALG